jgi:DNA-binding PadR family transcriptional regulator
MAARMTLNLLKVLVALRDASAGGMYGLELAKAAGVPRGTIFGIVERMKSEGWVDTRMEPGDPAQKGRPLRTFYVLNAAGSAALNDALANLPASSVWGFA